jgi:hypothetical protein
MTGERNPILRRNLRLRGIFTLACAGLLAAMAGCSDDVDDDVTDSGTDAAVVADGAKPDAAKPDATGDASKDGSVKADADSPDATTMDSTTADTSVTDVQTVDVSTSDITAVEASAPEAGADQGTPDAAVDQASSDGSLSEAGHVAEGGTPEAATEAGADAAPDAHVDAATEAGVDAGADVATADAAPDGPAAPSSLHMCAMFDTDWGVGPTSNQCLDTTTGACPDRVGSWGFDVVVAFSTVLSADCRLADMFNAQGFSAEDYGNELSAWTLQFFGCPDSDLSSGPLKFGLLPSALATHVFTTADLKALSDLYVDALNEARANPIASLAENPPAPLTSEQIANIRANLAALAAATPGIQTSNVYSFGACAADAGTDAHD